AHSQAARSPLGVLQGRPQAPHGRALPPRGLAARGGPRRAGGAAGACRAGGAGGGAAVNAEVV
ncbi:hypothetical protein MNEG_13910, partial [Monoraphidium neglectum]